MIDKNEQQRVRIEDLKGDFIEVINDSKKKCIFSKDNPFPLLSFTCPTCGTWTKEVDNLYLVRQSMCCLCSSWWNDQYDLCSDIEFKQKVNKFLKWCNEKKTKNEQQNINY